MIGDRKVDGLVINGTEQLGVSWEVGSIGWVADYAAQQFLYPVVWSCRQVCASASFMFFPLRLFAFDLLFGFVFMLFFFCL